MSNEGASRATPGLKGEEKERKRRGKGEEKERKERGKGEEREKNHASHQRRS